ncbi:hypothetical protein BKA62DRAFT_389808 [Auriculariales sp. MPI-PUGE-AT-0066]|nr:hypothetical protein BKA62DRAFT_389808 [Auriculariales sp. MPI-PUGE-AT-0066]
MSPQLPTISTLLLLLLLPALVAAQFGDFFQQMFHGQQQHHQRQQQSPSAQMAAFAEQVPCSAYLCPQTLDCVQNPAQCPCPNAEDIHCVVPDAQDKDQATVVCTRGANGCADVERLMNRS